MGVIPSQVTTIVVLVALITFITSAYSINNMNKIYKTIHRYFSVLENRESKIENSFSGSDELSELSDHIVVIGADQMGKSVIHALEVAKEQIVVVDFNPDVINPMLQKGITTVFGDISDPDIQERVQLDKARLVISTSPDL